jgi:hypothetical protein
MIIGYEFLWACVIIINGLSKGLKALPNHWPNWQGLIKNTFGVKHKNMPFKNWKHSL